MKAKQYGSLMIIVGFQVASSVTLCIISVAAIIVIHCALAGAQVVIIATVADA